MQFSLSSALLQIRTRIPVKLHRVLRFSFLGSCVQAIRDHATDSNRSSRHEKGLNRKLDMHRESERRGEAAPLRRNSSRIRESKGVVSSLDFHDDWNQQRRISLSLRGQYQSEREIESEEKSKGRNRLTWPTAAYTYRLYPSPDLLWFDFIRQTGATRERRSEPLSPSSSSDAWKNNGDRLVTCRWLDHSYLEIK